ncbi:hypothetical protein DN460_13680, partial [Enterobacter cloacae]
FGFAENTDDLFVGKTLLHGDVLMWLMKTLLTSGCTNQRGAGHSHLLGGEDSSTVKVFFEREPVKRGLMPPCSVLEVNYTKQVFKWWAVRVNGRYT